MGEVAKWRKIAKNALEISHFEKVEELLLQSFSEKNYVKTFCILAALLDYASEEDLPKINYLVKEYWQNCPKHLMEMMFYEEIRTYSELKADKYLQECIQRIEKARELELVNITYGLFT